MPEPSHSLKYALITPAWNEEAHLDAVIRSVVEQTILPVSWVIVSDGSTDRTDEIVRSAAAQYPWIRLLRRERSSERHFAGKAQAVNAAYESLRSLNFDLIGNLDADITLPPNYYEFLIGKFSDLPELGVAGTPFVEDASDPDAHSYAHGFADLQHVSGACQFFRRRCFEEIGGYTPVKQGGIDWVAGTTARMRGWTTRTFVERTCLHHRAMGTADRNLLRARFRHGQEEYLVGGHPLWQLLRGVFQMKNQPLVVGGLCLMAGYASAWATRKPSPVPAPLRDFHRREQMDRLRKFVTGRDQTREVARDKRAATLHMTHDSPKRSPAVLMIAYTNYEIDPRVIRAAEAAAEAGFDVDFIALRRAGQPAEETVGGVRIIRLPQERYRGRSRAGYVLAYLTFFLRCFVASTRLFVSRRYRVIHVNNMPDVLVFSVLIPRILGAKVILDIHDPMPETFGAKYGGANRNGLYRALLFLERRSVGFATRTVTVNHPVRDGVLAKHGYAADAIDVVANFADDRLFKAMPYPTINGRIRFVFHGTILERYGLRTLVEAVAQVRHRDKIHVRVIGEGDFSATLKRLIREHGVEDVIEFANRVYPLREIPKVLSDFHVGLVPLDITPISDFALPLKLIEYTCLGLPSITVNSTAISYYLRPEECMLYPPGDSTSLAEILDEIAEDPERLDEYRKRLPAAQERVSWSREKQKYVAMLRELAGDLRPVPDVSAVGAEKDLLR